jgi:hypothetical protein
LDIIVSDLLSLRIAGTRDPSVARAWCQEQIERDPCAFTRGASQRLRHVAILELAPKALREAYVDSEIERHAKKPQPRAAKARPKRKR